MPLNHGYIDSIDVSLSGLPSALEGLRVAHLTDTHIRRVRPRHHQMIRQLARLRLDLLIITGDVLADPGYEEPALELLADLCRHVTPVQGIFAVCGNHDTVEICRRTSQLPINWLNNTGFRLADLPLEVAGFLHTHTVEPDSIATVLDMAKQRSAANEPRSASSPAMVRAKPAQAVSVSPTSQTLPTADRGETPAAESEAKAPAARIFRFLLTHCANMLPTASDLGMDVVFAGHSHGGQLRVPPGWPIFNSSDMPLKLTSGMLRHRNTIALVSRGVGENGLPIRLFCPPHIPLYTFHEGPSPGQFTENIENVRPW